MGIPRRIDLELLRHIRKADILAILNISQPTQKKWETAEGADFLNVDNTWDLIKFIAWRERVLTNRYSGDEKKDLELEKLRKEIELKDSQVQKNLRNMIDKSEVEQLEASRAATLREFLTGTFMNNLHLLVGQKPTQLRVIMEKLIKTAMDVWTGAEVEKR